MNDPNSRNTELRPNLWRDPNELGGEEDDVQAISEESVTVADMAVDHVTPYSTGAEDTTMAEMESHEGSEAKTAVDQQAISADAITMGTAADPNSTSPLDFESVLTSAHPSAAPHEPTDGATGAFDIGSITQDPSSDPSIPTAEVASTAVAQDAVSHTESEAQASANTAPTFNPNPIDVQALLDTLQTAPSAAAHTIHHPDFLLEADTHTPSAVSQTQHGTSSMSSPLSAQGLGSAPSGLPPRPPPQEQPLIHPNYVHSQHIRDYHPHAANPAFQPHGRTGSQGNAADPTGRNFVPPVPTPTDGSIVVAAPQQQSLTPYSATTPSFSNGQVAQAQQSTFGAYVESPATSNFGAYASNNGPGHSASTSTPVESRREWKAREGEQSRHEDRPWDAEVQRKYDRFIEEERTYVSEGRWEQFPNGARLFVGKSYTFCNLIFECTALHGWLGTKAMSDLGLGHWHATHFGRGR